MGQVMNVEGCTALVTGANRGPGRALAGMLVQRGARKVYADARDPTAITDSRLTLVWLDVTSKEDISAAAAARSDVNVLINNAGDMPGSPALVDDAETAPCGNLAEMCQTALRVFFRPHPGKCSSRTSDLHQLRICGLPRRLGNHGRSAGIVQSASHLESAAREDIRTAWCIYPARSAAACIARSPSRSRTRCKA